MDLDSRESMNQVKWIGYDRSPILSRFVCMVTLYISWSALQTRPTTCSRIPADTDRRLVEQSIAVKPDHSDEERSLDLQFARHPNLNAWTLVGEARSSTCVLCATVDGMCARR